MNAFFLAQQGLIEPLQFL